MKKLKVRTGYSNLYEKIKGNVYRRTKGIYDIKKRDQKRAAIRQEYLSTSTPKKANHKIPYTVHMMLCKRDLEMAVCSALAFNEVMEDTMRFHFHDDGSLEQKDAEFVEKHLPGTKVILRKEADARAEKELKKYPKILEYRKNQIMALKIIDVKIWGEGEKFCYVDSDVLFFHKPDFFIKALNGENSKNYFNKDIQSAYMQTPEEIESFLGFKPYEKCNAGLWVMHRDDIDLDKINTWLNHPGFEKSLFGYTLDQTFISMLATDSKHGVEHLPKTYDVNFYKRAKDSVCKHYVGVIRHGYELEGLNYLLKNEEAYFVQ